MNFKALTTSLIMIFTFHQSASAYSPIFTIDGWNVAQLKEAGITVASWKHDQTSEEPPLDWVQISYDTSKVPKDSNVLMTLNVVADNGKMVSTYRAAKSEGEPNSMKILFAVQKEYLANSSLQIVTLVPESVKQAASRENPGFGGYTLSLNRVIELAQQVAVDKNAEQDGTGQPATRPESKSEGSDKPQPESEGRSR
jgi:hypothetical protein